MVFQWKKKHSNTQFEIIIPIYKHLHLSELNRELPNVYKT